MVSALATFEKDRTHEVVSFVLAKPSEVRLSLFFATVTLAISLLLVATFLRQQASAIADQLLLRT